MRTHAILLDVTPDDLLVWLQDCLDMAQDELALHPLRPRPKAMILYHVPLYQLYRFARELAEWCVGVYESLPETKPPFGVPLLLLGRLRVEVAEPNHVPIGIWRQPRFPLDLVEIAWELEKRFPSVPASGSPLRDFARPADLHTGRPQRPLSAPCPSSIPLPAPPLASIHCPNPEGAWRRFASNGMLPSTQWLADQLASLTDPVDPEPFYQEWAERYRQHTGLIPRDSARSFDKAIDSALKYLGRVRSNRR